MHFDGLLKEQFNVGKVMMNWGVDFVCKCVQNEDELEFGICFFAYMC